MQRSATSRQQARHLDSWHCVCVSILLFSHTAFSAQYDSVLAVCGHLLIGSTRIVWTSEVGVFLPAADARTELEENLNLKDFCKEANISFWGRVAGPCVNCMSVKTGWKMRSQVALLVEAIVILTNATPYCHTPLITCPHSLWNAQIASLPLWWL